MIKFIIRKYSNLHKIVYIWICNKFRLAYEKINSTKFFVLDIEPSSIFQLLTLS